MRQEKRARFRAVGQAGNISSKGPMKEILVSYQRYTQRLYFSQNEKGIRKHMKMVGICLVGTGEKDLSGCCSAARRRSSSSCPTGAAHGLEHFLTFLATGLVFGVGYARRAGLLTFALRTFAAVIEVAQKLVSPRHARMSDFLVDATANANCEG
jgi:VanZ family protein